MNSTKAPEYRATYSQAFTLVELLVVISVIATLASVILVALTGARSKGVIAASQTFDRSLYGGYYNDLSASWDFDSDSGTTVKDQSGNGNNLTVSSGALVTTPNPFPSGKVLMIDTSVPLSASPVVLNNPPTGDFSVSAWIWINTSPVPSNNLLISNFNLSNIGSWKIDLQDSSNLVFAMRMSGVTKTVSSAAPVAGQWYQVVAVCGYSSLGIYVNGKLSGTATSIGTQCAYNNSTGISMTGMSDTIRYYLDNVRVYKKALPLSEIHGLYLAELNERRQMAVHIK